MPTITFNSSLPLDVYHLFAGGGGVRGGQTPGLVSFETGPQDSWYVDDRGALSPADITTLVVDLTTYAAPALELGKSALVGTDLAPLGGAVHLDTLVLDGAWSSADLAGFPGLLQIRELNLDRTPVDDTGLVHVGTHSNLEKLTLSRTPITGAGLAGLAPLTQLRELIVLLSAFDDAGCALLSHTPSVRLLHLLHTAVTDDGIAHVRSAIPDLLALFLDRNAAVTDACVPDLVAMSELNTLSLEGTSISNAGVQALLALPELVHLDVKNLSIDDATATAILANRTNWQVLNFANTTMSDAALAPFANQQALSFLGLRCAGVSSAGIASLSACTALVDLDLSGCALDDSALSHLHGLSNLRVLNVENTGGAITQAAIDALIVAIPGLEVISDYS